MKKSTLFTTIAFAFVMLLSTNVNAQKFAGLDKSPLDISMSKDKSVKIVYSRPQLKGRSLSKLAPNGKVWRTGANEAAEIKFYKDVKFGGKTIKTGTYSLFTIPGEKEWTIIISSDINDWGAYGYKESADVVRITVPATTSNDSLEAFSIAFDDKGTMHMGWDKVRVAVPIN